MNKLTNWLSISLIALMIVGWTVACIQTSRLVSVNAHYTMLVTDNNLTAIERDQALDQLNQISDLIGRFYESRKGVRQRDK